MARMVPESPRFASGVIAIVSHSAARQSGLVARPGPAPGGVP